MTKFSENLRLARQMKKWNQGKLAEEMKMSQAAISQFEKGQRMPTTSNIAKFAEKLDISTDVLIGEEEGEFERVRLMRNIKSLPPDTLRKINDIIELIKNNDSQD